MNESGKIIDRGDEEAGSLKEKIATLQKENRELKESLAAIYEQAQESEKIYRTLVDLSFDSYFVLTDDEIVFVNQAGAKCIGFSRNKEAIGKKMLDYIHPDYRDCVIKLLKETLEEGMPGKLIEIKMIQAGGAGVDVEVAAAPFVYNDKKALLIVSRDISKRKQAEEKINLMALFAQLNPAPVMRCDMDGIIVLANAAARELFDDERLEGRPLNDIFPDFRDMDISRHIKENTIFIFSLPVKDLFFQFVLRGSSEYGVAQIYGSDITERKKAEEKLEAAKEQAVKATKLKDKFVSLVAHDLRSPFTSIVGLLRLMYDDTADPLSPGHRELMKSVLDSSNRQIQMIEELLNISRLQTGSLVPRKQFLDGALSAGLVIENLSYLAEKKGITIKNEIPPGTRLYADFDLLNEALQNLVSNAIKFCKEGDTITIFLPPGRDTTIGVQDSGSGIDGDLLPKLFKHEQRVSAVGTAGEKGSGLGLPYCHDIIASHGGKLTVETKLGEGSRFYAELPNIKPKILVVDGQADVTRAIINSLKALDVEFLEACDGKKGLEIIEDNTPHIIICDMDMPGMDGFEFIKKIREKYDRQSMPIIVTAGTFVMETKDKALRLGANDFAMKPIKAEELLARVKRFLI